MPRLFNLVQIRQPRVSPYLLLTLSSLFWAGNFVLARAFRVELPPAALSFWRWIVAMIFLLPFALPHLRRDWTALRGAWPWVLLYGALGTGGYNALAYSGLQHTTAINGTLLNSFSPIMIVVLAWLAQGKRLRVSEAAGILISLAGVLAIVAQGEPQRLLHLSLNIGDLWLLCSVVTWSIYTLLLARRPAVHPLSFLAAVSASGLLFLIPLYAWEMLVQNRSIVLTPASVAGIIYTGVFPALLGYLFWNRGVAQVGAAKAGLFIHLLTAFSIVLSMPILNESPAAYHALGIALILTGIWLNTRRAS